MPKKYTRGALELGAADDEPSAKPTGGRCLEFSARALVVIGGGTLAFAAGVLAAGTASSPPNTAAACPSGAGFDALSSLRDEMRARGHVSDRALVIGPGEGTTATRTLKEAFQHLGLRTCHMCKSEFTRTVLESEPSAYATLDFPSLLKDYDAIVDTPVAQLFPFILAAFPNAKVVHTVREATEWAAKRAREHGSPKVGAALIASLSRARVPAAFLEAKWNESAGATLDELSFRRPWENSSCDATRSACFADAIAFSAQNTYHRCITPPSQYLLLDAFNGDMCRPEFLPTLAAFVGRAVPAGAYAVRGCPQDS